jgi:hypothetical protein
MLLLRRFLLAVCLLLTGMGLGCSSRGQPMKNGARAPGGSGGAKPIPVNPFNSKKVLQPEPEGPPAPPLRK